MADIYDAYDSPPPGVTSDIYVFDPPDTDPAPVYVVAQDQFGNVSPPSNTVTVYFTN